MSATNTTTPLRAAIYCRVSGAGQADNYSPATQEAACRAYAEERGFAVVSIYADVFTGAKLDERPQLTALREEVARREVDAIIAHHPDRLARSSIHDGVLLYECDKAGVAIHTVLVEFDTSPEGRLMRSITSYVAEIERLRIRERTMRGNKARQAQGKLRPSNRPKFGYRWDDASKGAKGRYVIDEAQAPLVRRMYQALAGGQSARGLAKALNEEGVPTIHGGRRWHHSVIRELLTYPGYKGLALANTVAHGERPRRADTRPAAGGSRPAPLVYAPVPRPEEEWIALPEGTVPAIVSPALWDEVQERLRRNKAEAPRNNKRPENYLLRAGIVRCGDCGKAVQGVGQRGRAGAPERPTYRVQRGSSGHHDCPSRTITARELDEAAWARVTELLTTETRMLREKWARRDAAQQAADTTAEVAALDAELATIDRQRKNLANRIGALDDDDAAEPLLVALRSLAERKRGLTDRRAAALALRLEWLASEQYFDDLDDWCAQYRAELAGMGYQERRTLLAKLRVRVLLHRADREPRYEIEATLPPLAPNPLQGRMTLGLPVAVAGGGRRRSGEPEPGMGLAAPGKYWAQDAASGRWGQAPIPWGAPPAAQLVDASR